MGRKCTQLRSTGVYGIRGAYGRMDEVVKKTGKGREKSVFTGGGKLLREVL